MGGKKSRTAETKMVPSTDAQEAIQALDVAYVSVTELISAQAATISRLQRELDAARAEAGGAAALLEEEKGEILSSSVTSVPRKPEEVASKVSKKTKKRAPESKGDEKMEETPVEPEAEKEAPKEENNEEKKEELRPTAGQRRPPPSDASSYVEVRDGEADQHPPWKRQRGDQSAWLCYRCLRFCGNKSKFCKASVSSLSHAALVSNWVRIGLKDRPDTRGEYPELSREMRIRRLKIPKDKDAGERAIQDLRKAEDAGSAPPAELFETFEITEIPDPPPLSTSGVQSAPQTPMTPGEVPSTTPPDAGAPVSAVRASEEAEAFRRRIQVALEAVQQSGLPPEEKAKVLEALSRQP